MFVTGIRNACSVVAATVFVFTSSSYGGGDDAQTLRDLAGKMVQVYIGEASVVNHNTGEPADGSEVAEKIRPGGMHLLYGDSVAIAQTDGDGNPLPQGADSLLVSHLESLDADGVLYLTGERVPTALFIENGIVKNPGPDTVPVTAIVNGLPRAIEIRAGDAIVVNPSDINFVPEEAGGSTGTQGCLCDCTGPAIEDIEDVFVPCAGGTRLSIMSIAQIFAADPKQTTCEGLDNSMCGTEGPNNPTGTLEGCTPYVPITANYLPTSP